MKTVVNWSAAGSSVLSATFSSAPLGCVDGCFALALLSLRHIYSAISIKVVGLEFKALRQDRKVTWVVLNLFSVARQVKLARFVLRSKRLSSSNIVSERNEGSDHC